MIEKLSRYSVVIVEPRNISREQIVKLKEHGAIVYGYTSVIEQNESNNSFDNLQESYFYMPSGEKIIQKKWNSFYMDIRVEKYQAFLNNEIKNEIIYKELDGVFFDTVGDIDDSNWNEYDKLMMRRSYAEFLKKLKLTYKNIKIIQNWGIQTAYKHSSNYIDGIMWEGFSFELLNTDKWSKDRYKEINEMNIDFYIVSRQFEATMELKNKKTYVFIHSNDIYNGI
ncbi:MAG: putative glycoside hydrolase [Acidaminobacteraceae bacterium]